MDRKLNVLLLGYLLDGTDVGESYVGFKFAQALSECVNLTVLSFRRHGRTPLAQQLPKAEVVTWDEPSAFKSHERLNAMLKPAWFLLYRHVRRWLSDELRKGREFHLAHQIGPHTPRYPSPFYGKPFPYVIGPVGGGLSTPTGFEGEMEGAAWYTRLRNADQFRLKFDPWLRKSLTNASVVLGVAPYVADILSPVSIRRFECMSENGVDEVAPLRSLSPTRGLRLLHVGRAIRTKGLRDVVRALPLLSDIQELSLISAGDGEDLQRCKDEAARLGVSDKITFLGRIPRAQVEKLYEATDVFVFPSFREPSGGVLYEAMRYGIPIVTVNRGGPGYVVDESSGILLNVTTPGELSKDIADAIRKLYLNPDLAKRLGVGGRAKVEAEVLWTRKAEKLLSLYEKVLET